MNSFIKKAFGAITGALLLFLGIERRKNKKQREQLEEAENRILAANKHIKIQQATADTKNEILKTQAGNRKEKEEYEQEIRKAETEEVLEEKSVKQEKVINSITDLFNSRNHSL